MDVREAVARAKQFLMEVFADETIKGLRLEEVEYDEKDASWLVTLGVMRPSSTSGFSAFIEEKPVKRAYKVVRIPEQEGRRPSIKIREFGEQ